MQVKLLGMSQEILRQNFLQLHDLAGSATLAGWKESRLSCVEDIKNFIIRPQNSAAVLKSWRRTDTKSAPQFRNSRESKFSFRDFCLASLSTLWGNLIWELPTRKIRCQSPKFIFGASSLGFVFQSFVSLAALISASWAWKIGVSVFKHVKKLPVTNELPKLWRGDTKLSLRRLKYRPFKLAVRRLPTPLLKVFDCYLQKFNPKCNWAWTQSTLTRSSFCNCKFKRCRHDFGKFYCKSFSVRKFWARWNCDCRIGGSCCVCFSPFGNLKWYWHTNQDRRRAERKVKRLLHVLTFRIPKLIQISHPNPENIQIWLNFTNSEKGQ